MAEPRERAGGLTAEPGRSRAASSSRARRSAPAAQDGAAPAVAGADLTATEQRLLGDLFAVVEEHADETRDAGRPRRASSAPSSSPASATPTSGASPARTSSPTRSGWRRSAPACGSTPRRSAPRCCTTPSRTRAPRSTRSREQLRRGGRRSSSTASPSSTGITFQSRDEAQAENYRKMMVAMATDIRVILIKLADRLHNMRTLGALPKQKQIEKAQRDARDLRAARAPARDPRDQVGARGPRLRDAAPAQVRRDQGAGRPAARRARGLRRRAPAATCAEELDAVGIEAEISGRAKHFYSIYSKMTKKGREFNEIYDLTAMRVIVDSVKDCYGAIGVIHSLWKPLPGRFKDFIAMPKFNMYQSLHTTVIGPEGRPLEIQIRTREMHEHGRVRRRRALDLQGGARRQARSRRPSARRR